MAKGKGKKGKKEEDPNALTEVDKTFYELTITDLNRKLARLKTLTAELEVKNEELQESSKQADDDKNDVIVFLKRQLTEKKEEIKELQERVIGLEESRSTETHDFKVQIVEMEEAYRQMHEQLTSEIKLLTGKLNALEEFRLQRDELMKKFETQESEMEEQEIRHKREIYEIERKFIIGKDKLKRDMEARLLQLSTEFQDVTEIRIASTTHRVIRENIAINNELDTMLGTHQRLFTENQKLKKHNQALKLDASLHCDEKKKALSKAAIQYNVIERLTEEHKLMTRKLEKYQYIEAEAIQSKREIKQCKSDNDKLKFHIRILEQNLHAGKCERSDLKTNLEYCEEELDRLSNILYESVMTIKTALKTRKGGKDKAYIAAKREALLSNLLTLLSKAQEERPRRPSLESVESMTATYAKGDLGFVPKPAVIRAKFPVRHNQEAQVGASFEELLALYVPPAPVQVSKSSSGTISEAEAVQEVEKVSIALSGPESREAETPPVFGESSELEIASSSEEVSYNVDLPFDEKETKPQTEVEVEPEKTEVETTETETVETEEAETEGAETEQTEIEKVEIEEVEKHYESETKENEEVAESSEQSAEEVATMEE